MIVSDQIGFVSQQRKKKSGILIRGYKFQFDFIKLMFAKFFKDTIHRFMFFNVCKALRNYVLHLQLKDFAYFSIDYSYSIN